MGFHWVSITITSLRERSRVCATSTQQRLDGVPVRKIDNVNMIGVLSYPLQNHPPQATLESPRREDSTGYPQLMILQRPAQIILSC